MCNWNDKNNKGMETAGCTRKNDIFEISENHERWEYQKRDNAEGMQSNNKIFSNICRGNRVFYGQQ